MNPTTTIMTKDLRERLRDGTLVLFGLILPLGLTFLFTTVFGGDSEGAPESFEFAVVAEDEGILAAPFSDDVLPALEAQGLAEITEEESEQQAVQQVESGELDAAFILPEGFTDAVASGGGTAIRVVGNPDSPVGVQVAREVSAAYATQLRAAQIAAAPDDGSVGAEATATALESLASLDMPVDVEEDHGLTSHELDSATFHSAGLAYFFLFFAVMPSVTGLLRERETGTLRRLLAAPIPRTSILLGKALSAAVVAIACLGALMVISQVVFGADWGALLGAGVVLLSAALAAVALTSAVAVFAESAEQASNRIVVLTLILGLVGGAVIPVSHLGPFSVVQYLTPHYWFLEGLTSLGAGSTYSFAAAVVVLCAMAVLAGGLALHRTGRMLHS